MAQLAMTLTWESEGLGVNSNINRDVDKDNVSA